MTNERYKEGATGICARCGKRAGAHAGVAGACSYVDGGLLLVEIAELLAELAIYKPSAPTDTGGTL